MRMLSRKKLVRPLLFLRAVLLGGVLSFGVAAEAPDQGIDLAVKRLQAAGPHDRRGLNEFEIGDLKKAEVAFTQCIQEMPDHADALYSLANLSYLRKEYSRTKDYMESALTLDPRHAGAVNNLIAILQGAGHSAEAMEVLEGAEQAGLDEQLNLKLIERVHRSLGMPTEGILLETILTPADPSLEALRPAVAFRRQDSREPPLYENAHILFDRDSRQAVLLDPGTRDARIEAFVEEHELKVRAVLLTHGHEDHIGAADYYADFYDVPTCLHAADAERLPAPPRAPGEHGTALDFDGLRIRVLHTPGHSKGGACYLAEGLLFSGDTLFRNNIGRVRPEEDMSEEEVRKALIESIQDIILPLASETRICPGHGKITPLRREKAENPFLK